MNRAKSALASFLMLATFAFGSSAVAANESVIVCTKTKAKLDDVKASMTELGCSIVSEIPFRTGKYTIFQVKTSGDVNTAIASIRKIKGVDTVEKTFPSSIQSNGFCSVNDPDFPAQYSLQSIKWNEAICTLKLLGVGQRATPRITVVDSGCARINAGNEMTDITQFNFEDGANGTPEVPFDSYVHGTAVAALACARSDNGFFISGVGSYTSPVKLISCRVSTGTVIDTFDVIDAMVWCVDNQSTRGGPGVINLSINSNNLPTYNGSRVIQEIARNARLNGDLFVNGAGNASLYDPSPERFLRRVVGVDENNAIASFSNTAPPLTAAAPAVNIATFSSPQSIGFGDGTSFSGPIWAGAVCLLQSINPSLNAVEADAIIYRTATRTPDNYKMPDLQKAVTRAALFPWL